MQSLRSNLDLLIAAAAIVFVGAAVMLWFRLSRIPEPVFCTQEAMECPDGSFVGRTGPKCEFSPCPATPTCDSPDGCGEDLAGLVTKIDSRQGVAYRYTEKLPTVYIQPQDWPPIVTVTSTPWSCTGEPASTSTTEVTAKERLIDGRQYCVKESVGAAAGSVYTSYGYSATKAGRVISVEFTLRAPQCANYSDPEKTACEQEYRTFNPDTLAATVVLSLKDLP
ncbi:hypothetical protein HGA34_05130 [Candidatus Falkowbacteria bacterium]|nr:hypothetical protein [Candidatus Falkowbacteria bacterium]